MSIAYPIFTSVAGAPSLVSISSVGIMAVAGTGRPGGNGLIINDISLVGVNHNAIAAGSTILGMSICLWDGANTPFPIMGYNFRVGNATAGNATDNFNIQRSFPNGLIGPSGGYTLLTIDTVTFTNLSIFNFTLDMSCLAY